MGQSSGAGWKGHAGSSHIQRQPSLVRLSPCSLPQCAPGPTSIPPLRLYLRTGPRARAAARGSRSASRQCLQQSILCEGLCHSLGLSFCTCKSRKRPKMSSEGLWVTAGPGRVAQGTKGAGGGGPHASECVPILTMLQALLGALDVSQFHPSSPSSPALLRTRAGGSGASQTPPPHPCHPLRARPGFSSSPPAAVGLGRPHPRPTCGGRSGCFLKGEGPGLGPSTGLSVPA